jgi:hypothetical protein
MAITISGSGITSANIADGTIVSGDIADGTIVNADINSSAAIAGTKVDGSFGKVLQVVSGTPRASSSSTSTTGSWVNAGVSVSITPSSTSSKILVLQTLLGGTVNGSAYTYAMFTLQRSIGGGSYSIVTPYSSTDGGGNVYGGLEVGSYSGVTELQSSASLNHLDSPNTTSECTFLVYYRTMGGYGTAYIKKGSTIIALEIAG